MASRSVFGTCGRVASWYALPSYVLGGFSLLAIPCRPAAIVAANARYGLASAPGMRFSTRKAAPSPQSRKPHVRLSQPTTIRVGANEPAW